MRAGDRRMTLLGTSLLSGLAVIVKLLTSLFLSKVLAVYVGPAGYGVIGQFQSLVSMVTTFASGATANGVIKLTAERRGDRAGQRAVWATAATIGLAGAAAVGVVLVLARSPLARWLLGSSQYAGVLVWLALALALLVLNGVMLAILNGCRAVRELAAANIVGSLIGALVAFALVNALGLWGALLAVAVSQAVSCGFTAWIFKRVCRTPWREMVGRIDTGVAKSLGRFALMAATTATVAPLGQMVIRDQLASTLGWEVAGLWQALWKISETHLLLLTSTLSVYFLPRFAEIRSGTELTLEVRKGYRFVIPTVFCTGLLLFAFRERLIRGLLTESFMPLASVLGLQLVGDALKICSWVVSFTMVSHARTRAFVVTEVVFTALYVAATVLLSRLYGLEGTAIAYGFTYLIYWLTVYALFRSLITDLRRQEAAPPPLPRA
jgi:PST family polysaccharide transporter